VRLCALQAGQRLEACLLVTPTRQLSGSAVAAHLRPARVALYHRREAFAVARSAQCSEVTSSEEP
jgi:hypothetical protein